MSNTAELESEIQALLAKGQDGALDKNVLHLTQVHVCESAAGCYIGTWCVEFDHGTWFPSPYERLSGYGSREQMLAELPHYRANH